MNHSDEAVSNYLDELFSEVDEDTEISAEDRQHLETLLAKSTQGVTIDEHKNLIPLMRLTNINGNVAMQLQALLELISLLRTIPSGKLRLNVLSHCKRLSDQINGFEGFKMDTRVGANLRERQKEMIR